MPITIHTPNNQDTNAFLKHVDVTTSLNTGGTSTAIDLNIPSGAMIVNVSAKVETAFAGVSTSGVTAALAFTGGSTQAIGNLVAAGNGNVAANTELIENFTTLIETSDITDAVLTFSGGADNTPSAGAIRLVVAYLLPFDF
jgi:hypothetical protein